MQHGTGFMGRGPLSSAFSSDGGKTWRNVGNPADDGSDGDHAFIDLTADDRGNFHAVWLDKRSGTDKGLYSAFFESNSQKWNKTALWTVRFATVVGMLSNPVVQGGSMPCTVTKCQEIWG